MFGDESGGSLRVSPTKSCRSHAFTSFRRAQRVVATSESALASFRAAALVSIASSCKAPVDRPRLEHLERYLSKEDMMRRPVLVLFRLVVLCGLAAVVTTGCGGEDNGAGGATEDASTRVQWGFPGASAPGAVNDHVDAYYTEDRLRDAPNGDELPIRPGSPDDSADPNEGTDGPSVSVPPTIPSGQRVSRAALVEPPSGHPATTQKKPWRYVRKRWTSRQDIMPMSASGTFFIRSPYRQDKGKIIQWCSGTVVSSQHGSLVWTAAHCVYDPKKKTWFNKDVVFVPGYKKGARPFGTWAARTVAVHPKWMNLTAGEETWSHDVAVVVLEPKEGKSIQEVVGSQGIWFGLGRGHRYVSNGYPVERPFKGDSLFTCTARFGNVDSSAGSPATTGIGCDMTGGSSGGGWLIGLSRGPSRGVGWVFSVNSYGYGNDPEMYGPYHGEEALAFYRRWSQ